MDKTFDQLSPAERKVVLKGLRGGQRTVRRYRHKFSGDHVRFGVFSDPHIGEKNFDWGLWYKMADFYRKEKITTIYSPGDIVEGMSGRDGQVYDLEAIGFEAQAKLASKALHELRGMQVYSILGNHDLWFKSKGNAGANIGTVLEEKCDHFHCLGEWEADIELGKGTIMKIVHPADGTAYAVSYKLQKRIEALDGGKKPAILISGHYHKALYLFLRNVHGFECGTLCGQTQWMRGKGISAHKGFWLLDVWIAKSGGVEKLVPTFIPGY